MSTLDEVAEAQREVGLALDRARAGDDRELAAKVRELGEQLRASSRQKSECP